MNKDKEVEVKLWIPKRIHDFWQGNEWFLDDYQTIFLDIVQSRIRDAGPALINKLNEEVGKTLDKKRDR